jgi:hypothetical protein
MILFQVSRSDFSVPESIDPGPYKEGLFNTMASVILLLIPQRDLWLSTQVTVHWGKEIYLHFPVLVDTASELRPKTRYSMCHHGYNREM